MRRYVIAGNWKMNKTFTEADDFISDISEFIDDNEEFMDDVEVLIFPPSLYLELATDYTDSTEIFIGAQDVSSHESGAYTGEISAEMLNSMETLFCLVGHSERRKYHYETDEMVNAKVKQLLKNSISPIICIGETEKERAENKTDEVILKQLKGAFEGIDFDEDTDIYLAYEPVWAIGTGKTATPQMAQEVHALIRKWIKERFNEKISNDMPILYGGSVKPENIKILLEQEDIDLILN